MKKHCQLCLILLLAGYLGVANGHLALWKDGCSEPKQIFPRSIYIYPQDDQIRLKNGIPFSSIESLTRLLEDFLS